MESKINAITLKVVSFGENDAILTLFSIENGVVSAKIKGVKKAGAKLKFVAQPFCFSEIVLSERLNNKTVIGASVIDSFYPLRQNLKNFYSALCVLEYVKAVSVENESSPELFSDTVNVLKTLAYAEKNPKEELIRYLLKALKSTGYELNFDGCIVCGGKIENKAFFDFSLGGGVCENCADENAREIYVETFLTLKGISEGKDKEYEELNLNRALKFLDYYIVLKTDEKLKSIKELTSLN